MEFYLKEEDIELLQNDILDKYGYDFTGYSKASFRRRMQRLFSMDKITSLAELRYRIKTDADYFTHVVEEISVNVTEMFRDAQFYKTLREKIIPILATYPFIRIWHAGCATGEEVYSMAILLQEAGLLHKTLLYGTDINPGVLEKARKGIFSAGHMQQYSKNYLASGGLHDFSSYYTAHYNLVKFDDKLSKRMVFSTHNLVSDASFNSFQLILCRNVLIYFDKELQSKVLRTFDQSLNIFGFLALGAKESLRFSPIIVNYRQLEGREKIWRKIK